MHTDTVSETVSPSTCFRAAPRRTMWQNSWGTPWRRQKGITLHSFGSLRERVRRIMESPRRTGDNRHTVGTAKDRAEADTVKPKEIVAGEPVSSLGCIANTQVVWIQSPFSVNSVSFVRVGRFCVTPASQFSPPAIISAARTPLSQR